MKKGTQRVPYILRQFFFLSPKRRNLRKTTTGKKPKPSKTQQKLNHILKIITVQDVYLQVSRFCITNNTIGRSLQKYDSIKHGSDLSEDNVPSE